MEEAYKKSIDHKIQTNQKIEVEETRIVKFEDNVEKLKEAKLFIKRIQNEKFEFD